MPEVGNDNISAYADDPRGYMNNRDVTRAEREKQWIVALASTNQLDPSKVKKSLKGKKKTEKENVERKEDGDDEEEEGPWEPYVQPPKKFEEPNSAVYFAKKRFLYLWCTRRWDYAYLSVLGLILFFVPLNHSNYSNGAFKGTLQVQIGLLFLLMWGLATVPVVGAVFTRKTMWPFIKSRGSEERRSWSVMYIMGLRATSHNPQTWWRESPSLRQYIRCLCPKTIRLLPCSERMEKTRLKLTIPCQALAKTLYYLLCLPFNLTAPVGVGPDVDLSAPPEAQNAWEKKKKAEAEAPRKYWNQQTGEILVMTPAEKEERDERLRLEAEKNAREEAERIAREEAARKAAEEAAEAERLAEEARLERRRLRREAGESSSSEEETTDEEAEEDPAEIEEPSMLSDPSQESAGKLEGEAADDKENAEGNNEGESLDGTGTTTTAGGLSQSAFAVKSTKATRKPQPMPHEQRLELANQSSRDPLPLGWEEELQPKEMKSKEDNVVWRCRVCGRDNNMLLVMDTKSDVNMEIIKKPIPGTAEMTYKVNLAPREAKQKCRVCGTYYDYKPPGCYVENFFTQKGDDDLIVYRKHKDYDKAQKQKLLEEEDTDDDDGEENLDPSKRKKKERVAVLGDKVPVTQYMSSKDEIMAEVEASKDRNYKGYSVQRSRPPRLASNHEFKEGDIDEEDLAALEAQERKEDEDAAQKAALERARREEEGPRTGIYGMFLDWYEEKVQPKLDRFKEKKEQVRVAYLEKRADARIKCEQTYEKFMTSKPTQFAIRTYRGMKTVYNIAANQTKASRRKAELESDMVFNDFRFKRRELEFRPPFPRYRNPDTEQNEFYPLWANVESIAHNPSWYPGIITRVHMNNTYDIRFENGEDVQCVEPQQIRFRLRLKVSVLMQVYAMTVIFFVHVMPLELAVFYLSDLNYKAHGRNRYCNPALDDNYVDDFKKDPERGYTSTKKWERDDDRPGRLCMGDPRIGLLVAPVFVVSFVMTFGHGLQLLNSYIMRTHAAGALLHIKFWIMLALPGIFLSLMCYMVWGKFNDGASGGGSLWTMSIMPLLLFSMSLAGQVYLMQPLYAKFFAVAGFLFFLFIGGLAMDLDFDLLWPSIYPDCPLLIPFMPAYFLLGFILYSFQFLDHIWDAAIGMNDDVEPELAALKSVWLRSGVH